MRIEKKSCEYYVSELCFKAVKTGKVKKSSLIKCLKKVSNSIDKMGYNECSNSMSYLKEVLSSNGSKIMDKKLKLLELIFSYTVKVNYNIDALQHCMIDMQFKRNIKWKKDFGVSKKEEVHDVNDDLAEKLKFNLLKRDFLIKGHKVVSGIKKIY